MGEEAGSFPLDQLEFERSFIGIIDASTFENEVRAWNFLENIVDQTLANYPTSLAEDIALLEADDTEKTLGFNTRNCIMYRKLDKQLLAYWQDTINKVYQL